MKIDLGHDVGQNYGSLFELLDEQGKPVAGAGFLGAYNTYARSDRHVVHLFVHTPDEALFEPLPLPRLTTDAGVYLFDLRGKLFGATRGGRHDALIRTWNSADQVWTPTETRPFQTHIGGHLLVVDRDRVDWRGQPFVELAAGEGSIGETYYGNGWFLFRRHDPQSAPPVNELVACPWSAQSGEKADRAREVTVALGTPREFVYSFGQLGDQLLAATNTGGVYMFDGAAWHTLRSPDVRVSFQIYAMLNYRDRLLMGHYPTGEIFSYDGKSLERLPGWPPVMKGVSGRAREAQTLTIYGGDLYAGVWPWGELWRYDEPTSTWTFMGRMFSHPEPTDATTHPYEEETTRLDPVLNRWGQRVTSLVPQDDALYIGTSAKSSAAYEPKFEFLGDDKWKEYGTVYRYQRPGALAAAIRPTEQATTLEILIHPDRLEIHQDGVRIAQCRRRSGDTALGKDLLPSVGSVRWGEGVHGLLRAELLEKEISGGRGGHVGALENPPAAVSFASRREPLSPRDALSRFVPAEGVTIEPAACEPQISDPVAARFDEDGRLWVVEMIDYPDGPAAGEPAGSRVSVLEDRDGDGFFETAHRFAEQLVFPTGVEFWQKGVIVTSAGRIDYMMDTDGDLRADRTETWFRGFAEDNTQLRANHPTLALDGHIYVANGLRGGEIVREAGHVASGQIDKPVSIQGRDMRFHPVTRMFEAVSGHGQFGLCFDDFASRFVCSNRNPLRHIVLEDEYLRRAADVPVAAVMHDVASAEAESKVHPISRAWTTSNLHAGQFTAACGVHIYRGDGLPSEYCDAALICEPTGNLVHAERLEPLGATFTSKPHIADREFVASTDEWFRPVDLTTGPDGSLYVVDMYRAVIEHPEWMPDELKRRPDLVDGRGLGRIWRIRGETSAPRRSAPRLSDASTAELVKLLEHPSAWHRATAARRILEGRDPAAGPLLMNAATAALDARNRAAALELLAGLDLITHDVVRTALDDGDPRVRRLAVARSEPFLKSSPELRACVAARAEDPDPRVRFQTALSLGTVAAEGEIDRIAGIAVHGADDPWTQRAVLLVNRPNRPRLLQLIADQIGGEASLPEPLLGTVVELAKLIGQSGSDAECVAVVDLLSQLGRETAALQAQQRGLAALGRATRQRGRPLHELCRRAEVTSPPEPPAQRLRPMIERAAVACLDDAAPVDVRLDALDLLAGVGEHEAIRLVAEVAGDAEAPPPLRMRAIAAMARDEQFDPTVWHGLLEGLAGQLPSIRRSIVDACLARGDLTLLLLSSLESGAIAPSELDRAQIDRIVRHNDPQLRHRAEKLLQASPSADRTAVVRDYTAALQLNADPRRGKAVFARHCATCHRIGEIGIDVGPDISDSRVRTAEQLLVDILDPNRAVDGAHIGYTLATADGRVLSGVLVAETSHHITVRQAEGRDTTVARSELESIRSSGVSMMPEGFEKDISLEQMGELVSFIKNWRYLGDAAEMP